MGEDADRRSDVSATAGGEGGRWRRLFTGHDPVGMAALLLSLVLALINGYYVLRHAEVVVQPPQEILLFRDGRMASEPGEPDPALLFAAVRLPMINTAAEEYGDLLDDAFLRFEDGARFPLQALVEPTFRNATEDIECPLEVRCVAAQGLLIRQFFNIAFDVPGGSANARMVAFPLHSSYCEGPETACAQFGTYRDALARLAAPGTPVFIDLAFVKDGEREVACTTSGNEYVEETLTGIGWHVLDCDSATVTGDPIL